jgi:hyperosmotically inducible periplasmic protein
MMIMTHRQLAASLTLAFLTWGSPALAQQGPIGQGLNDAGRAVKRGFQTAGQAVSGSFQKTRTSVHNMEVVSRIYSRLHWEKALTSANLEIEVQAGGIAIITGIVPNEAAKIKALSLTAETVGVVQVVDQLAVGAATTPATVVPGTPPTVIPAPTGTIIVTPPPSSTVVPPVPKPKETDTPL